MSTPSPASQDILRLALKELGLKPGMALQTRRLTEGAVKKESQFYGAIEGKGVMVGPLGIDGATTELDEGDLCVVRGFTGQYEFSFLSKVLQTFEKPFVYALLAYPPQVDARRVRRSMRTRMSWPGSVRLSGQPQQAQQDVTLVDLSTNGAMIKSPVPLGAIGGALVLTIAARIELSPVQIQVHASICHNNRASGEDAYFIGMVFSGISPHNRLTLLQLMQATSG